MGAYEHQHHIRTRTHRDDCNRVYGILEQRTTTPTNCICSCFHYVECLSHCTPHSLFAFNSSKIAQFECSTCVCTLTARIFMSHTTPRANFAWYSDKNIMYYRCIFRFARRALFYDMCLACMSNHNLISNQTIIVLAKYCVLHYTNERNSVSKCFR